MACRTHTPQPPSMASPPNVALLRPRFGVGAVATPVAGCSFPFASQLIPHKQNLSYLINSTILTRFMTSVLRVTIDHPRFNPNPDATPSEKMNTFLERMFVEFIGTGSSLLSLQLSMDMASKVIQNMEKLNPHWQLHRPAHILAQLPKTIGKPNVQKIEQALESALGKTSDKLMFNVLFKHGHLNQVYESLKQANIRPETIRLVSGRTLDEGLSRQFFHLNLLAKGVLVAGALGNALWGGFGVQLLNDKLVAPILVPKVKALFGVKPSEGSHTQGSTPTAPAIPPSTETPKSVSKPAPPTKEETP